jgi:hypothetical protein
MKRMAVLVLSLLCAASAFAESADAAGQKFSVRTFQFKHKQADQAAGAIKSLLSPEGSMAIQPSTNSLVVTDRAENLRRIAAALTEFDVEARSFQLSIRLVSAARAAGAQARVAAELSDVAPKLALLRYNVLDSVGSATVHGSEGEPGIVNLDGYRADFRFGEFDPASDSIRLSDFRLGKQEADELTQLLKTSLNLKLGQTVILAATRQPESQRALMIVVTATR